MVADDFLMELFRSHAVDVRTLLENSSFPFATRILESIKRNEQQIAKGAPMEGIPKVLVEKAADGSILARNTGSIADDAPEK